MSVMALRMRPVADDRANARVVSRAETNGTAVAVMASL